MRVEFLDLSATYGELAAELDGAVARVMRGGWYVLGAEVERFEASYAEYCGTRHCIGVGNGLDALHLVLRAWDIGPGDEVIVPANTYIATWLAVSYAGATPVPVEPDPGTCNIEAESVAAAITSRTRAVIPVHLYGQPANIDPVLELAERHGFKVLEDAAQSQGATYRGKRSGALGHAAAHSFYPGKNLGAFGDAGAVTTSDDALADRVRMLRNYGSSKKYYNDFKGFNTRLDEIQAAILGVKLKKLDEWNARRQAIAEHYLDSLHGLPGLVLPVVRDDVQPAWHLFVVRHPERDRLQQRLRELGIDTLIHYPVPPHLSAAYFSDFGAGTILPLTEELAATVLSLPIGPHMGMDKARAVSEAMRRVLEG